MAEYYRVNDVKLAIKNSRLLSREEKIIVKEVLQKCEPVDANDEEIGFRASSAFYEDSLATALHRAKNAREMAYILNDSGIIGADLLNDITKIIERLQRAINQ